MAKTYLFLVLALGITLMFHFTGIIGENEGSTLIGYVSNPEDIRNFDLWSLIQENVLALSLTGIIAAGAILTGRTDIALASVLFIPIWNVMLDFLAVYNKIVSISPDYTIFAQILLAVPIVSFILVILDWVRGKE